MFSSFNDKFDTQRHSIELADGTQSKAAKERGTAHITIMDANGRTHNATLNNALYVPDYPCDIFSVAVAVNSGATVSFGPDSAKMITQDGNKFNITKKGKLYYLPTANNDSVSVSVSKECTIQNLHCTMGHCNVDDLLKLQNVVDGIKITNPDEKFFCVRERCPTLPSIRSPMKGQRNLLTWYILISVVNYRLLIKMGTNMPWYLLMTIQV